jgi:hypothetical protein
MVHLTPFYWIGTIGFILTALLHIPFRLLLKSSDVDLIFFIQYLTFATFLSLSARDLKNKSVKLKADKS